MPTIPIYDEYDLRLSGKDGNTEIEFFADFISQLLEREEELSTNEISILELINEKGTQILNKSQIDLLKNTVSGYEKSCVVCNSEIPLNEVFFTEKYCSYHNYLKDE